MTITIPISAEAEARLRERAEIAGVNVETYAARLIESLATPPMSMVELSGPVAKAFEESGMTEDELAEFLEEEKHAMRAERRARERGNE
jgi:hypothetical protein